MVLPRWGLKGYILSCFLCFVSSHRIVRKNVSPNIIGVLPLFLPTSSCSLVLLSKAQLCRVFAQKVQLEKLKNGLIRVLPPQVVPLSLYWDGDVAKWRVLHACRVV